MIKDQNLGDMSLEEIDMLSILLRGIREKKFGEKMREEGKAFETLECIFGKDGHEHDFQERKYFSLDENIEQYRCTDSNCREIVYKCPTCGYVPGLIAERPYDDIGLLCGSAGTEYLCRLCSRVLGSHAFKFS